MDFYGDDRKLSELGDQDFHEFLERDVFTPSSSTSGGGSDTFSVESMDQDWLESFFEDPVLNDRMISDALQPPHIQSEHSYSLANSDQEGADPIKAEPLDKELDPELLRAVPTSQINLTLAQMSDNMEVKQEVTSLTPPPVTTHNFDPDVLTVSVAPPTTSTVQPTIILATPSMLQQQQQHQMAPHRQDRLVLPKVNIKMEYDQIPSPPQDSPYDLSLPPTPPSSSNSDSEGGCSPQRSAPSSPQRSSTLRHSAIRTFTHSQSSPLFTSPIPTSGVLILTEEEKRTLISEGYPIPAKLPLTKQEEKNLKKIRRKIKNKISAQESRRKKKEYLETLEKRMEGYNQENSDLKKKVEQLENNNRSLLSQLHKLQSIVSKVRPSAASSTQTGTCLMVLVLCFAVFLGTWSPSSLSIGYRPSFPGLSSPSEKVQVGPVNKANMGPAAGDAYATPNKRSRVLMSIQDGDEVEYGPATPFNYKAIFASFFKNMEADVYSEMEPEMPHAIISDMSNDDLMGDIDFNATKEQMKEIDAVAKEQASSAQITANFTAKVSLGTPPVNATA